VETGAILRLGRVVSGWSQAAFDLGDQPSIRERRRAAAVNPMLEATFSEWWARYPSGKKGDRAAALRAFVKALKVDSLETIERQLANYVAARALYAGHFGGDAAPLRHASTWLNGARSTFSEPWTLEDCTYWPAPDGKSWRPKISSPRGETREEMMARERAEFRAEQERLAEERAALLEDPVGGWAYDEDEDVV